MGYDIIQSTERGKERDLSNENGKKISWFSRPYHRLRGCLDPRVYIRAYTPSFHGGEPGGPRSGPLLGICTFLLRRNGNPAVDGTWVIVAV